LYPDTAGTFEQRVFIRIWHATTYRAETTLNYGLERAWSIAAARESNGLAIGYDEGTILIKLGHDAPVASLDTHTGKLVWANNNDIQSTSLKGLGTDFVDGRILCFEVPPLLLTCLF